MILTGILISVGITVVVYFGIALVLTFSERPPERPQASDSSVGFAEAIDADYTTMPAQRVFTARDGSALPYRLYEGGTERMIVLVHGSGWHGMQFHPMAEQLAARGLGTVVVPDLRGHGENPERRGDVDYIGQFEDDLADLITELGEQTVYDRVILGGHSSGGGLMVRFAGGEHGHLADGYVLMAPFLKHDAPTTRPASGGWAHTAIRRIIGLSMLNNVGVTALNHLPVISFAMSDEVLDGPLGDTATLEYSHRLNTGFAPRDTYERDMASLTQPFLLIAGADDEAFVVDRYEEVLSAQTDSGDYEILPGVSHIGVTVQQSAIDTVAEWVSRH